MRHEPSESRLQEDKDFPSLPELLEHQDKKDGYLKIPEQSDEFCYYTLKKLPSGDVALMLRIRPRDTSWRSIDTEVVVDSLGYPVKGEIIAFPQSSTNVSTTSMSDEQIKKVLKYLEPELAKMKKEKLAKEKAEKEKDLPRFPSSLMLAAFGLESSDRVLSEWEMRDQKHIVKRYQDLPYEKPSLPLVNEKVYIHTDQCSFMIEHSKSLLQATSQYGCYVFYFPKLKNRERTHSPDPEKINVYQDAVIFPKMPNGDGILRMASEQAYKMAKSGADDVTIYEYLRERGESAEREFNRLYRH